MSGVEDNGHDSGHGETDAIDPGCVKTLRGISAPGILSPVVMRRARKRKNLSSYDQISFRFRTAKTRSGRFPKG